MTFNMKQQPTMRINRLILLLAFPLATTTTVVSGFHSLPLVPHHVQKERQRRLLGGTPKNDLVTTTTMAKNDTLRRPSRFDRDLKAQQVGALYQGYGTHYVDLWCGSPTPQRQTVIVDTGSAVTAFPCSGCSDHCGKDYHIDLVFEESQSSTFERLPCNDCMRGRCTVVTGSGNPSNNNCIIGMSYQEGSSWTAFEARDYCYIGGPHGTPLEITVPAVDTFPDKDVDPNGISTTDVDPALAAGHAFPLVFGCQTKLTGLFKTQVCSRRP
jgi:Xylanase inhibitor N-terminal